MFLGVNRRCAAAEEGLFRGIRWHSQGCSELGRASTAMLECGRKRKPGSARDGGDAATPDITGAKLLKNGLDNVTFTGRQL